jgi:hypothetical protein
LDKRQQKKDVCDWCAGIFIFADETDKNWTFRGGVKIGLDIFVFLKADFVNLRAHILKKILPLHTFIDST